MEVDEEGRCAHWRSPLDIVSFRFPCCDGFWACHACHEAEADHPARRWPAGSTEDGVVLCGRCRGRLGVPEYLASPDACPRCGASFNPRCRLHHTLYFADTDADEPLPTPHPGDDPPT